MTHATALFVGLLFYVVLGLSFVGWGEAVVKVLRWSVPVSAKGAGDGRGMGMPSTILMWIGWAAVLLILQLVHLFLPLNAYTVIPIFGVGLVVTGGLHLRAWRSGDATPCFWKAGTITGLAVLVAVAAWLASRSMLPPENYDTGLYHLNTIRWINAFPIVPGLGNLHARLAFNSSFFCYVAALNLYPFFGCGRSIANSFLLILALLTLLECAVRSAGSRKGCTAVQDACVIMSRPVLEWLPALFGLPILAYWALSSNGLASPSSDLTSSILQLIIFVVFAQVLADGAWSPDNAARSGSVKSALCRDKVTGDDSWPMGERLFALAVLTATAVTVKLSNLVFCGAVMMIAVAIWVGGWRVMSWRNLLKDVIPVFLTGGFIALGWCARSIILSGAPLFPATFGYMNTEWSVPLDSVRDTANWVASWARGTNAHWSVVLGNWNWLGPWWCWILDDFTAIVYPVRVFIGVSVFTVGFVTVRVWRPSLLFCSMRGTPATARPESLVTSKVELWLLPIPLIVGLLFWFFMAPDPRFAGAMLLLLPVSAIALLADQVQRVVGRQAFTVVICSFVLIGNLSMLYWGYLQRSTLAKVSLTGWHNVQSVPLRETVTKSGLRVWVPVTGDQCWDAPIPCTPYFNENLRLRRPNDLSSGFTVKPNP